MAKSVKFDAEYKVLMQRCGAGVLILDSEGQVIRSNELAQKVLGLGSRKRKEARIGDLDSASELGELLAKAKETHRACESEVAVEGSKPRALNVLVAPVSNTFGDNQRYLLVAHDITELRRLEQIRRDF